MFAEEIETAQILIEAGANPDFQDELKMTALIYAASYGLTETVS